jgi:hypothetical protein
MHFKMLKNLDKQSWGVHMNIISSSTKVFGEKIFLVTGVKRQKKVNSNFVAPKVVLFTQAIKMKFSRETWRVNIKYLNVYQESFFQNF